MAALTNTPQCGEPTKVRLGKLIAERRYNFRQSGTNDDQVETYYRRLCNGETPPPIEVDRKTMTIIDGMHRFRVWKRRAEEWAKPLRKDWRDFEIEVLLVDEAPDRDKQFEAFLVETVKRNRAHGEPIKRADIIWVLKQVVRRYKYDKEAARRMALVMNETNESFESEWRKIHGRPEVKLITSAEGKPEHPPVRMTEGTTKPAPAEIVRHSPPPPAAPQERLESEGKPAVTETVKGPPKSPRDATDSEAHVAPAAQTPPTPEPQKQAPPPPKNRHPFMASYADQLRQWIEAATEYTPEQVQAINRLRAAINDRVPPWQ